MHHQSIFLMAITMTLTHPALSAESAINYPPTRIQPVTDTLHGKTLVDSYRWLEGDAQGRLTDEVIAWTDAQNALTRQVLDHLPGRAALESRLTELMEVGYIGAPAMRGDRYFYRQRSGKQNQSVVMMRQSVDGQPRLLLDPNTLDADGLLTVSWTSPSHDGALLAFGVYTAGDENSVCHILDVESGQWLADEIPGKVGSVDWLPDGSGFVYRCLADLNDPYSGRIKLHRVGRHPRQDPVLFEQYKDGPLATTWGPFASLSYDGRWLLLGYSTGTKSNDLWIVDFDHYLQSGEFVAKDIVVGEDSESEGEIVGDTLFMQTNLDAPNGRIVAVDLHQPAREHWREIITERPDHVLRGFSTARGLLAADYLHNASTRIELFDHQGASQGELELPGLGRAGLKTHPQRTEAFLSFESFNQPDTIYRIDLATGERQLWEQPDVPVDPQAIEVKQVWCASRDGTKVSMFLVHKKGLALNGDNPTLLTGYGGFNISRLPSFSATLFPWLEAGGVYALPNLRGGGEYGKNWHEAGMLQNKQNVFDDFFGAAQWLIENKYTNPKRLAVAGGSNGGLLTGAALTQRPDLFAAAISAVPLLDMVRYQDFLMARYWVPEYGSSEDAAQFEYLLAYSPYHRIQDNADYPAVMLTAGENDARVHPLHARKMAAKLQAVAQSKASANPVLLWVDRDAGHGAGKPLRLVVRDLADQRIFLMWRLGMLKQ